MKGSRKASCYGLDNKSMQEPWFNGYGRRLMFRRAWVQIPAPYTGGTFFTFTNGVLLVDGSLLQLDELDKLFCLFCFEFVKKKLARCHYSSLPTDLILMRMWRIHILKILSLEAHFVAGNYFQRTRDRLLKMVQPRPLQRVLNSDRWKRRQGCWPLDHRHGPKNVCLSQCLPSFDKDYLSLTI